jgi:ABC-type phosphate transport system substrate-binding protein
MRSFAMKENSIGYIEYSYAAENNQGTSDLDWGLYENGSRNFRRARLASIRASTMALTPHSQAQNRDLWEILWERY